MLFRIMRDNNQKINRPNVLLIAMNLRLLLLLLLASNAFALGQERAPLLKPWVGDYLLLEDFEHRDYAVTRPKIYNSRIESGAGGKLIIKIWRAKDEIETADLIMSERSFTFILKDEVKDGYGIQGNDFVNISIYTASIELWPLESGDREYRGMNYWISPAKQMDSGYNRTIDSYSDNRRFNLIRLDKQTSAE